MTRLAILAAIVLAGPAAAAAQAPASGGAATASQTVRAAGMPLTDGALPPGSLTVRLVQGAFAGDLAGVTVEVEVDGRDIRRAQTGTLGRAEFAHLPVGASVRASALVNGERLQSEPFPMPAEGGVRVLLVTAAGGIGAGGAVAHLPPPAERPASLPDAAPAPSAQAGGGAAAVRITVVSLTILAFVLVGVQRWRRRRP